MTRLHTSTHTHTESCPDDPKHRLMTRILPWLLDIGLVNTLLSTAPL